MFTTGSTEQILSAIHHDYNDSIKKTNTGLLYKILGVGQTVTADEIKKAYKNLALICLMM